MANNPLNTGAFTFWLRFNSLGHTNWYQISEPPGFDGARFNNEQEPKKFNRSIDYGAVDKLKFIDYYGEPSLQTQTINPQGDQSNHLDYGLQWLLYIWKKFGFEMDVDFKIMNGNVDFRIYGLDASDKDLTDGYTYFQCKLIDNSKVMDYKRRFDDTLNAFSDKGVFQQAITPLPTFNYLKRATPVNEESIFELKQDAYFQTSPSFPIFSVFREYSKYEIKDTLTFLSETPSDPTDGILSYSHIKAKNTKTNITIKFDFNYYTPSTTPIRLRVLIGADASPSNLRHNLTFTLPVSTGASNTYQNTVNIPVVYTGERIAVFFSSAGGSPTFYTGSKITYNMIATSNDIVMPAVRYYGLFEQGNKMLHDLPMYAPKFGQGGKFYDQAVFNKAMISGKTDKLFFSLKSTFDSLEEVCADAELSNNEFFMGQYEEFYTNDEIQVLQIIPSEELTFDVNDRFVCNKIKFGYNNYSQNKDTVGSDKATHTQSEWLIQNKKVENTKDIKIDLVRDEFLIQDIFDQEVKKPSTTTEDNEKLCIEEMVPLAPGSFGIVNGIFLTRSSNGNVEILNYSGGDDTDALVNWSGYGIGIGSTVQIVGGALNGFYTVVSTTIPIITLTPQFTYSVPDGTYFISLKHFYTNVQWQTRTDEGFSLIDGLPRKFGNLGRTIKRNMFEWGQYFASMLQYCKKDLINSGYKTTDLKTQLTTEANPVVEKDDIPFADFPAPILTGNIINMTCVSDFDSEVAYANTYQTGLTPTAPRRKGFVRVLDLKGNVIKAYRKDVGFNIFTNELSGTWEEKYEPPILTVNTSGADLIVNDTIYNLTGNANWYRMDNGFVKFFDDRQRPISNFYNYDMVRLNGVIYTNANDLAVALNLILI